MAIPMTSSTEHILIANLSANFVATLQKCLTSAELQRVAEVVHEYERVLDDVEAAITAGPLEDPINNILRDAPWIKAGDVQRANQQKLDASEACKYEMKRAVWDFQIKLANEKIPPLKLETDARLVALQDQWIARLKEIYLLFLCISDEHERKINGYLSDLKRRHTTKRKEAQAKMNPFIHRKLKNTRVKAYMFYSGHLMIDVRTPEGGEVYTKCR